MWVSTTPDKAPNSKGSVLGLTKVVELNGCCREVSGTVKVTMKKGSSYYIMGRVKEGGGGEYLDVGMQMDPGRYMPLPVSMFDTTKKLSCGGSTCRHYWFGINGVKIPNLINHPKYKTFAPDKSEEMAPGTNFKVNRDDIKRQGLYSTNNMGSMIEGWFKVAEDGDCFFFTRRSVRP